MMHIIIQGSFIRGEALGGSYGHLNVGPRGIWRSSALGRVGRAACRFQLDVIGASFPSTGIIIHHLRISFIVEKRSIAPR